jgi:hypothetical protein
MMPLASANLPAGKLVNLSKLLSEKALEQALHLGNIQLARLPSVVCCIECVFVKMPVVDIKSGHVGVPGNTAPTRIGKTTKERTRRSSVSVGERMNSARAPHGVGGKVDGQISTPVIVDVIARRLGRFRNLTRHGFVSTTSGPISYGHATMGGMNMRSSIAFAALALAFGWAAPSAAQMCGSGQTGSTTSAAAGMMCGTMRPSQTQAQSTVPQSQPQQRQGMCGCCQQMAMMRPSQGNSGSMEDMMREHFPQQQSTPEAPKQP